MEASDTGERDFSVDGIACRTQSSFNVKVGAGIQGTRWAKRLQFVVKLRVNEDHECAARRWLASERGRRHARDAQSATIITNSTASSEGQLEANANVDTITTENETMNDIRQGLFADLSIVASDMSSLSEAPCGPRRTGRRREQLKTFNPEQSLSELQSLRLDRGMGERWRKAHQVDQECTRPDCKRVRGERDELRRLCEQQASEARQLRDAFQRINLDAGLDAWETTAAEHLQQGLLEMLGSHEEKHVRLRFSRETGQVELSVLVHHPEEPATTPAEDEHEGDL